MFLFGAFFVHKRFSGRSSSCLIQSGMRLTPHQVSWIAELDTWKELHIPNELDTVLLNVKWGRYEVPGTPAFWKHQVELQTSLGRYQKHNLGLTLYEEVAACLLGGYGIPAEMGLAAFERMRKFGLVSADATYTAINEALCEPFQVGNRLRHYRFARQKAKYLHEAFSYLANHAAPVQSRELRSYLLGINGVGPKTSSWIVRNHLGADDVAVIDVHLVRACKEIGLFNSEANATVEYFKLEELFLKFSQALQVRASVLDAIVWDYVRRLWARPNQTKSNTDWSFA